MPVVQASWNSVDPQNPHDLLGRPIAEGDFVAWGVSVGRSVGVSIGEILKINFKREENPKYPYGSRVDCPQAVATGYTLKLRPMITTGYYSTLGKYVPEGFIDPKTGRKEYFEGLKEIRPVTLQHVGKVLKMDKDDVYKALRDAAN